MPRSRLTQRRAPRFPEFSFLLIHRPAVTQAQPAVDRKENNGWAISERAILLLKSSARLLRTQDGELVFAVAHTWEMLAKLKRDYYADCCGEKAGGLDKSLILARSRAGTFAATKAARFTHGRPARPKSMGNRAAIRRQTRLPGRSGPWPQCRESLYASPHNITTAGLFKAAN
jgi:hypothetical protein